MNAKILKFPTRYNWVVDYIHTDGNQRTGMIGGYTWVDAIQNWANTYSENTDRILEVQLYGSIDPLGHCELLGI